MPQPDLPPLQRDGRPIRILLHGMNYGPELTGVGRYSGEIGDYLAARGAELTVITTPPHYPGWKVPAPYAALRYASERRNGAAVIRCPILLRERMRGIWRVLAPVSFAISSTPVALWHILARRPQVVLCVEPTLFSAPLSVLAARLVGARTALHVQDLEIDAAFAMGHVGGGVLKRLALAFERFTLRRFDNVITISGQMRRALEAKGVPTARLAIVRNWVDLDRIRPLDGPNGFRRELGLSDDQKVVLYAGSVGAKQALPVMLEAAVALKADPRVVFVVAGEGPAKPDLMARYGHLPNVRFLPLQPEERLCELVNLADLHMLPQDRGAADLVLPSKLGGILASGRPALVTADPGTELYEFLDGTALLVPAGDTAAVVREISRYLCGGTAPNLKPSRELAARLAREENLAAFAAILTGTAV